MVNQWKFGPKLCNLQSSLTLLVHIRRVFVKTKGKRSHSLKGKPMLELEQDESFLSSWSWSRINPSSPAPAGPLQLRAPLPRSPKLGALLCTDCWYQQSAFLMIFSRPVRLPTAPWQTLRSVFAFRSRQKKQFRVSDTKHSKHHN